MRKIITFITFITVIYLAIFTGFTNKASANDSVGSKVNESLSELIEIKSIYDDAVIIKPDHRTEGLKTTKYTKTKFYKVKYDYLYDSFIMFNVSSHFDNHEIYVYDENYLSVGNHNRYKTEVNVSNAIAGAWYYIEVREIGPAYYLESPFSLATVD